MCVGTGAASGNLCSCVVCAIVIVPVYVLICVIGFGDTFVSVYVLVNVFCVCGTFFVYVECVSLFCVARPIQLTSSWCLVGNSQSLWLAKVAGM